LESRGTAELSLYRRLGGYDAIAAIIDDLFALLRGDPRFSRFGTGRSIDSQQRARQLIVDQICWLSRGPCYYIGRDMNTSHAGLGITEPEWEGKLGSAAHSIFFPWHRSRKQRRQATAEVSRDLPDCVTQRTGRSVSDSFRQATSSPR
jgi:hemoglobin